jgi:hypothetical protein
MKRCLKWILMPAAIMAALAFVSPQSADAARVVVRGGYFGPRAAVRVYPGPWFYPGPRRVYYPPAPVFVPRPPVILAPPPVYYAPAPVIVAPPPVYYPW